MSKRCRHRSIREAARLVELLGDTATEWGRSVEYEMDGKRKFLAMTCVCKCGAWLSLGESNDEPEAVRVEIEAASMSHVNPDGLLWAMTLPGATQHTHEALCLAYAIATHEESQ